MISNFQDEGHVHFSMSAMIKIMIKKSNYSNTHFQGEKIQKVRWLPLTFTVRNFQVL